MDRIGWVLHEWLVSVGSVLESALDLSVGFGLGDGVPLVVELFTAAKPQLYLNVRSRKIQ